MEYMQICRSNRSALADLISIKNVDGLDAVSTLLRNVASKLYSLDYEMESEQNIEAAFKSQIAETYPSAVKDLEFLMSSGQAQQPALSQRAAWQSPQSVWQTPPQAPRSQMVQSQAAQPLVRSKSTRPVSADVAPAAALRSIQRSVGKLECVRSEDGC